MQTEIFCQTIGNGKSRFWLIKDSHKYFLFDQNFRRGVRNYFHKGVSLDRALKIKTKDAALQRTSEKLPLYLKTIEKEYQIQIFRNKKQYKIFDNDNYQEWFNDYEWQKEIDFFDEVV